MNEELKTIFGTEITVGTAQIPTAHIRYFGKSKTFVVWTIISDTIALVADDEDVASVVSLDVDVYTDGNYTQIVNTVKKLMKQNDWIWTEDSPEMYEEDTGLYHITCNFEKGRSILWQE